MIAANEHATTQRYILFWIERRKLFGPRVSNAICLDVTPAVNLWSPPSAQLITRHRLKITRDDARKSSHDQVLARWGITRRGSRNGSVTTDGLPSRITKAPELNNFRSSALMSI